MPTLVRSYSKVNLGLAIGHPRPDGFHSLVTLYQTLALHDLVTITARRASRTSLQLTSNDPRVPRDSRNTAWKMVELALAELGLNATVNVRIEKRLPIQGGMGAGSANAAAALAGLERELELKLSQEAKLRMAAEVGSDVPLFLIGGSVLGSDRGQTVRALPDVALAGFAEVSCVIALPAVGVSTPQAFRDWDALLTDQDLHSSASTDTLRQLSRAYAMVSEPEAQSTFPPDPNPIIQDEGQDQIDLSRLLKQDIRNDFETVVFPQQPLLREIRQTLLGNETGSPALYAALSGSGSALFGLYRSAQDAEAARQRLQIIGVAALVTTTMSRARYWSEMFAE